MKNIWIALVLFCITNQVANAQSTITVNTNTKAQTITGFGAAIAYYDSWLTSHPQKAEIYNLIFKDLDLGVLRIRNVYSSSASSITDCQEIVQQANTSLGHPVDILLSSWSPPASLKANGITNGGTLLKTNNQFVYTEYAQWWYDAILFYTQKGIIPTYISMQNEPDYENTGWETCIFKPTETTSYPGYGKALQALSDKLQNLSVKPKVLGPEVTGIGSSNFQNYVGGLNKTYLDGYAYHLYNGGNSSDPDSYNSALTPISSYNDKPNIMTEFSGGTWFNTAWLIQNCLLKANASGYLYWDLIWGSSGGMVTLENPWQTSTWTTTKGYKVNGDYYALKHFSKYISKGYKRISATVSNTNIRPSAFISPDSSKLTVVLLNVATNSEQASLSFNGFTSSSVVGFQSVADNYFYSLESVTPASTLLLPARSVTTLVFTRGEAVAVSSVAVTPLTASLPAGGSTQLLATVLPANATNKLVSWTSSDNLIATVSSAGLVTGKATGLATITATTADGSKTATCTVTVTEATTCTFGTPLATSLPSISKSYSKVYVLGTGGPSLSNVSGSTINWSLANNGLYELSISTNNGSPSWYNDLRTTATVKFNQVQPEITFTNSGFAGLDGAYWVTIDGTNLVLVSKTGGYTIYFSNSTTAPVCLKCAKITENAFAENSLSILFPNPFSDRLKLQVGNKEIKAITVTNQLGAIVLQLTEIQTKNNLIEFGEYLPAGVYIIHVKDADEVRSYKVVKIKR